MYSTCSMDPVENEAVVAEVLRRCPYLELVPMHLEGLHLHPGLTDWPVLDEEGEPVPLSEADALPFFQPEHLSPKDRLGAGVGDRAQEAAVEQQLPHCLRLWHEDNNTGGFFVAQFRHVPEGDESTARAYRSRRATRHDSDWTPTVKAPPKPTSNSVVRAEEAVVNHVESMYGINLSESSLWQRGKRLNLAPPMVHDRLFKPRRPRTKVMCGVVIPSTPSVWFTPDCPPSPSRKGRGVLAKKPSTPMETDFKTTWRPYQPRSSFGS